MVSKGCLYYFLLVDDRRNSFCGLTLFDLLDDIIRNRIRLVYVIEYFVFLTPHILLLVIPMSVLLAILINFGILEKSSQVTALKAGGWSLYRVALPVLLLASVLCVGLYFMQDYFLPYANIRQDSIRHLIKGRPPQTSMRPQRKWIFGESNRIFNYDYFDSSQKVFVGLNVRVAASKRSCEEFTPVSDHWRQCTGPRVAGSGVFEPGAKVFSRLPGPASPFQGPF